MISNNKTCDYRPIFIDDESVILDNTEIIDLMPHMLEELYEICPDKKDQSQPSSKVVYFPWLKKHYRILDKFDYLTVRSSRNRNKIAADEASLLQQKSVGIIGQSTGSQLAYILAQEGICGHLTLIDEDLVSLSNLNRIRTDLNHVGKHKTVAIAQSIAQLDPYLDISIITKRLDFNEFEQWHKLLGNLDVIVDACDDIKTKIFLRRYAQQGKIPVIMETNDLGRIDIERYDIENLEVFQGTFKNMTDNAIKDADPHELFQQLVKFIIISGGISKRMLMSLPEIGKSLQSYPQLASETIMGAAALATYIRMMFLNQCRRSGVFNVDIEAIINNFEDR